MFDNLKTARRTTLKNRYAYNATDDVRQNSDGIGYTALNVKYAETMCGIRWMLANKTIKGHSYRTILQLCNRHEMCHKLAADRGTLTNSLSEGKSTGAQA